MSYGTDDDSTTSLSSCTILLCNPSSSDSKGTTSNSSPTQQDICKRLESPDVPTKLSAIQDAILGITVNGESFPKVLMAVIRFASTHESHALKKILMIYYEVVPKVDPVTNKLLPEMILVCNALLNDLNSPNEYIRGCMLRFLCKIHHAELLEPLKDAVSANLSHRHAFVRRNAVLAVFHIYQSFNDALLPHAPELIEDLLTTESDSLTRRNAFLMLYRTAEDRALAYLSARTDVIGLASNTGFALVILELARNVCRRNPDEKSKFIRIIFTLLSSSESAVAYEAAWTLVTLSSAPTAIRAAAKAYTMLLQASSSDNNLKLIVLERLRDMKKYHSKVLSEILMDIMRAVSSPSIHVSTLVLDIVIPLVSSRNIEEVLVVLKREVSNNSENDDDYRSLLIKSIHTIASNFPSTASDVVMVLMDLMIHDRIDVMLFVKEMVMRYEDLRTDVLLKLVSCLSRIESSRVLRVALWIVSEFKADDESLSEILNLVGPMPLLAPTSTTSSKKSTTTSNAVSTKSVVLADGTYATEVVYDKEEIESTTSTTTNISALRKLICEGDFFLASAVASSVTKILLKNSNSEAFLVDSLVMMAGIVSYGTSTSNIDNHSKHRIETCIKTLLMPEVRASFSNTMTSESREVFNNNIIKEEPEEEEESEKVKLMPDDVINFRQLRGRRALGSTDIDIDDGADINRATGAGGSNNLENELKNVRQLTGLADPVYVEAKVVVRDYDIRLEFSLINQTPHTLNNVCVDISTIGDHLKVVEVPAAQTSVGPFVTVSDKNSFSASIKVSSTETGHIFGSVVFDSASGNEKTVVNLCDIHLDIMDYIHPSSVSDEEFRSMWAEFEWENKVAVTTTSVEDIAEFVKMLADTTHMKCMTPIPEDGDDCSFLAANLYAKSVFGEDALVNVSVEKNDETKKIGGYIRIRSKTQGIALSLGDRITAVQSVDYS